MPIPEDVSPRTFQLERVLYDDGEFAVAWGVRDNGNEGLAMRWNGDDDHPQGYPTAFGNPVWFNIPPTLALPFVKPLLGLEHCRTPDVLTVLPKLVDQ